MVEALLHPRNVALVGASNRPRSMGMSVIEGLQRGAFPGPIYPVNSRYEEVAGLRCYPGLAALPEAPDHVVLTVPAASVIEVLREAVACGARSATVMSAGFEGNARDDQERREALRALVRESGLSIVGPNCMGNFSAQAHFMTLAEARVPLVERGTVAIAGQSGGVVMAMYRSLWDRGIGSSYVVTTGDELGLNAADYIAYFATCDDVRVILYYLEGVREPERFAEACRAATRAGKRVILLKVGQSAAGREAVALHTGAPPTPAEDFAALIAGTGAICARTLDEAVEGAEFLSYAVPPRGGRIAVMVFSGGLKGLVADCADRVGATLAPLAADTLTRLEPLIETGGSVGNPLDFGPPIGGTFDAYLDCVRALRADPAVDVLLLQDELLRTAGSTGKEENFARLDQLVAEGSGVPIAMFAMISHSVTDYGRTLRASFPHLPFLQEPAKALRIVSQIGAAAP